MRKVTRSQIPKGIVGLRDNCVAKIKYRCSKDDFKHNVYVCVCVSVCVCVCSVTQLCPTLCNPMDYNLQVLLSLEFSRQEYWSGLPFPL